MHNIQVAGPLLLIARETEKALLKTIYLAIHLVIAELAQRQSQVDGHVNKAIVDTTLLGFV